jgi:hypothetical protein
VQKEHFLKSWKKDRQERKQKNYHESVTCVLDHKYILVCTCGYCAIKIYFIILGKDTNFEHKIPISATSLAYKQIPIFAGWRGKPLFPHSISLPVAIHGNTE